MVAPDLMYVPISFEYLLSNLFGKLQYHGYVGAVSSKIWKRDIGKIAKYIRKRSTRPPRLTTLSLVRPRSVAEGVNRCGCLGRWAASPGFRVARL
jgi:hypothetical protein